MNEARPYASLSSGLLARKGTAKPAMRPQGYAGGFDDLGWNDMGHGRPEAPEAPAPEHVPSSIAALTPAPRPGEDDVYGYGEEAEEFFGEAEELEAEPAAVAATPAAEPEPVGDFAASPEPVDETVVGSEPVEVRAPSVVAQQRAILERFDGEEEAHEETPVARRKSRAVRAEVVPIPRRASGKSAAGRKSAFTLRLDVDRHLRLRLACAVTGRSAQQILTGALDAALGEIPEIEALATRAAGAKRN
jgi:hypothetical protein